MAVDLATADSPATLAFPKLFTPPVTPKNHIHLGEMGMGSPETPPSPPLSELRGRRQLAEEGGTEAAWVREATGFNGGGRSVREPAGRGRAAAVSPPWQGLGRSPSAPSQARGPWRGARGRGTEAPSTGRDRGGLGW